MASDLRTIHRAVQAREIVKIFYLSQKENPVAQPVKAPQNFLESALFSLAFSELDFSAGVLRVKIRLGFLFFCILNLFFILCVYFFMHSIFLYIKKGPPYWVALFGLEA
ncbi:hypothetical protein ACJJIU_18030 [Microbulbifer sp. CnH-101-E]|uniref:hypothetical protein n=1 Tax=Microbulbifer sp. CnH-101-E TaxID=3243391 RepID=UPI0040391FFB